MRPLAGEIVVPVHQSSVRVAPNAFPTVGLYEICEVNTPEATEVRFWANDETLVLRGAGAVTDTGKAPGIRVHVTVRGNRGGSGSFEVRGANCNGMVESFGLERTQFTVAQHGRVDA